MIKASFKLLSTTKLASLSCADVVHHTQSNSPATLPTSSNTGPLHNLHINTVLLSHMLTYHVLHVGDPSVLI